MVFKKAFLLVAIATFFVKQSALAAGDIGRNDETITTSDYSIDLYQGPVFAGSTVTGMAGAHVAIAEDVDGDLQNPAAPANRPFFSTTFFDWWVGMGITLPGSLSNMDFFNSGSKDRQHRSPESLLFLTPALNLQWGPWGMGITTELQGYSFSEESGSQVETLRTSISTSHLQLARSFWDGQFVAGVGSRILLMTTSGTANAQNLFSTTGSGLETGILIRPTNQPFRIGAAFRTGIKTEAQFSSSLLPDENGDVILEKENGDAVYVPSRVSLPWDLNTGVAVQFGKRPFNRGWRAPSNTAKRVELEYQMRRLDREVERERRLSIAANEKDRDAIDHEIDEAQDADKQRRKQRKQSEYWDDQQKLANMKRRYLLISTSLLVSGPSKSAVGIESFLNQVVHRSGEKAVVSPRIGMESEIWPDMMKIRAGSYLEPPRFETSSSRGHATANVDIRLIRWSVFGIGPKDYLWRLMLSGDVARNYFTWGVMVGGWYPRHKGEIKRPVEVPR